MIFLCHLVAQNLAVALAVAQSLVPVVAQSLALVQNLVVLVVVLGLVVLAYRRDGWET